MANPKVVVSITADDDASAKLKKLEAQTAKTQDGMSRMSKAGLTAGAAVAALGVASVLAFEDLGLTVGKFADATGATTEEASRLIEVADDLGISSDTLSSSIGKMSKQLGANEQAFSEYGIAVVKAADGTTDVNETFLGAVDAINGIPDPLKKAEAAAKVFGKGYQGMSELLGESSDKIRADLAAVSDAKVFDDKKVKSARDMRDAFDSIVDAGQDLLYTIGSALAPVIVKLAPKLVKIVEAAAPVAEALGEVLVAALESVGPVIEALLPIIQKLATALTLLADVIAKFKPTGLTAALKEAGTSFETLEQQAKDAGISTDDFKQIVADAADAMTKTGDTATDLATLTGNVTTRMDELTTSSSETARETRKLGGALGTVASEAEKTTHKVDTFAESLSEANIAYQRLTGELSEEEAWDNVNTKMAEFAAATDHSAEELRSYKQDVADYVNETKTIPAEKKTEIFAAIRDGDIAEIERLMAEVTRTREIYLKLTGPGAVTAAGYAPAGTPHASGGVVGAGEAYQIVGEQGPEAVKLPTGSKVSTASQTAAMKWGRGDLPSQITNVYVAGSVLSERDLIAVLKRYTKGGGRL